MSDQRASSPRMKELSITTITKKALCNMQDKISSSKINNYENIWSPCLRPHLDFKNLDITIHHDRKPRRLHTVSNKVANSRRESETGHNFLQEPSIHMIICLSHIHFQNDISLSNFLVQGMHHLLSKGYILKYTPLNKESTLL